MPTRTYEPSTSERQGTGLRTATRGAAWFGMVVPLRVLRDPYDSMDCLPKMGTEQFALRGYAVHGLLHRQIAWWRSRPGQKRPDQRDNPFHHASRTWHLDRSAPWRRVRLDDSISAANNQHIINIKQIYC